MQKVYNYFFIGVGGISMSALCLYLYEKGYNVAGYDKTPSEQTKRLKEKGIDVFFRENVRAIEGAETVVYSGAISENDKLLLAARRLGKKVISRGELLGKIACKHKKLIAIAGAHGKTTTTALISSIFIAAGLNPTVHIGGVILGQGNMIVGGREIFITEACEYKDSFLSLHPTVGIVLNVEEEHLDYFKTFDNIKHSFCKFVKQSQSCIIDEAAAKTLGLEKFDYLSGFQAKNFRDEEEGITFDCFCQGKFFLSVRCPLHGEHNKKNILVAIACAKKFGITAEVISAALQNFKGVERRYQQMQIDGVNVIFDYAHHPSEIKAVIKIAKSFCKGRLFVIFQPHTYSRTKTLFGEFLSAFDGVDKTIIFKTFPAREKFDKAGDGKTLATELSKRQSAVYCKNLGALGEIKKEVKRGDTVLVVGAGDLPLLFKR